MNGRNGGASDLADLEIGEYFRGWNVVFLAFRRIKKKAPPIGESESRMVEVEALAITRALTATAALVCILLTLWRAPRTPVTTYFALFAGAMFCAALAFLYGPALGPLAPVVAIGAIAGCGWFWLFARALFQPEPRYEIWPLVLVGAIIAPEMAAQIIAALAPGAVAAPAYGAVMRVMENAQALTSSTVLVLVLAEAARGYNRATPLHERRFRLAFIAAYGALAAVSVLWVRQAAAGSFPAEWGDAIRSGCMLAALAMAGLAVRYRLACPVNAPAQQPAPANDRKQRPSPAPAADAETAALARKIAGLFERPEVYTTPTLKVADLAAMLGQPDYKVSRCITGAMGFANFNRLVNFHRIEHAKAMLSDPSFDERSILAVGMDCGFGSIGPFNRAFKEATGATPRAWRAARATREHGGDFACGGGDEATAMLARQAANGIGC